MKTYLLLLTLLLPSFAVADDVFNSRLIPFVDISVGSHGDATDVNKFGCNMSVGTTQEDIWDGGGTYTYLSTADQIEVFSGSGDDTADGTGARTVDIYCLDSNFNEVTETVTLLGASVVTTTVSCIRVYRAQVITVGSGGVNAGNITIRSQDADTLQAEILADQGQTLMCIYTIPAGYQGLLLEISAGVEKQQSASVDIRLYMRKTGESWQIKDVFPINSSGAAKNGTIYTLPLAIDARTDVRMTASSSGNGSEISCRMQIILKAL